MQTKLKQKNQGLLEENCIKIPKKVYFALITDKTVLNSKSHLQVIG